MSALGKAATVIFIIFGAWFAIVGIVMDEARFDGVRIGAVALIGFGIVIAMLDRNLTETKEGFTTARPTTLERTK